MALVLSVSVVTLALPVGSLGGDLPEGDQDIKCNGLVATKKGTNAAETINGTNGNDVIVGFGGSDTINGLGGHDTICGAEDHAIGHNGNTLNGGAGTDVIIGDAGRDVITGGSGVEDETDLLYSAPFQTGTGGRIPEVREGTTTPRQLMNGGGGEDYIYSGTAGDSINGGNGPDHLFGGIGDDTFGAGAGRDGVDGGFGDDIIFGGPDPDRGGGAGLFGGPGLDEIDGGRESDLIDGGFNADRELRGGPGPDTVRGGDGDDKLFGDRGEDNLFGQGDKDALDGGPQDDDCEGGGQEGDTLVSCNEPRRPRRPARVPTVTIKPPCTLNPVRIETNRTLGVKWLNKSGFVAFIDFDPRFEDNLSAGPIPNGGTVRLRPKNFPRSLYTVRCVVDENTSHSQRGAVSINPNFRP